MPVKPQYELLAVSGPMKGDRFPVPLDRPIKIGRSRRGVCLNLDELASLEHAELSTEGDRFFIKDLGSQTGTFVNGNRIGRDAERLEPGAPLEVGQTVLLLQRQSRRPLLLAIALGIALAAMVVSLGAWWMVTRPITYEPVLHAGRTVSQGPVQSADVRIPTGVIRTYGADHSSMVVRDVTDYDGNGVDEVWLRLPDRQLVVTFNPVGAWVILGELPLDCTERKGLDFPEWVCAGMVYQHRDGRYRATGIDGVVAWVAMGDPDRPAAAKSLTPFLFSFVKPERLAGFLAARGVTEPVHYLICEEAIKGVRAHVLTASGEAVPLGHGCLSDLGFTGPHVGQELKGERPLALAFTVHGRQALIDDLTTYASGGPDGLFVDGPDAIRLARLADEPANYSGTRVGFEAEAGPFEPVAAEAEIGGVRSLARAETASTPPAAVTSTLLEDSGRLRVQTEGCAELEIEVGAWTCARSRGCFPNTTFLVVREVGCGGPKVLAEAPYGGGLVRGRDAAVEVAVKVDSSSGVGRTDALRARVSHRLVP